MVNFTNFVRHEIGVFRTHVRDLIVFLMLSKLAQTMREQRGEVWNACYNIKSGDVLIFLRLGFFRQFLPVVKCLLSTLEKLYCFTVQFCTNSVHRFVYRILFFLLLDDIYLLDNFPQTHSRSILLGFVLLSDINPPGFLLETVLF